MLVPAAGSAVTCERHRSDELIEVAAVAAAVGMPWPLGAESVAAAGLREELGQRRKALAFLHAAAARYQANMQWAAAHSVLLASLRLCGGHALALGRGVRRRIRAKSHNLFRFG